MGTPFGSRVGSKAQMSRQATPQATPRTPRTPRTPFQRAALNRLQELPAGYEFVISVKKSNYMPPRATRHRKGEKQVVSIGTTIDKLNIDVVDQQGTSLRIEAIKDGLVATWNIDNKAFAVKPGDVIVRVNTQRSDAGKMLEELKN